MSSRVPISLFIVCFALQNMKQFSILLVALMAVANAQFPNGRILEPPVPSQCVQRTIHERYADSKSSLFCFIYVKV